MGIKIKKKRGTPDETMELVKNYIDGKEEISDILKATINRYMDLI